MKIIGNTVGTSLPKPNMMQTDPSKGDYVKGKEEFVQQFSSQNVNIVSIYKAKTISILGDSISTFKGHVPEGNAVYYTGSNCGVSSVDDLWWKKLIDAFGASLLVNESWSGSRVTTTNGEDSAACMARCEKLGAGSNDPDVIIVYIGINDFNNNVEIGTYDGNGDFPTVTTTFREAYAIMLNKILNKYPNAEVWVCTLPYCERTGDNVFPETNGNRVPLHYWNRAIRELADMFGVKVLEHAKCGLTYQNMGEYMGDYADGEGLHMNANGHSLIANNDINQMDNYVRTRYAITGDTDTPDAPADPEVTLTSISATYSDGSVPVGTAVTALTGIAVTAHYSDGSTATVTDYTLSGSIAEGENTVTVTYQGMTATFTVTGVSAPENEETPDNLLYSWDFTKSLTDSISGQTATLYNATQNKSGVNLGVGLRMGCDLGNVWATNRTIELDVSDVTPNGNIGYYSLCFVLWNGKNGITYRTTKAWGFYIDGWDMFAPENTDPTCFAGTMRITVDAAGYVSVYANNQLLAKSTVATTEDNVDLTIGVNTDSFNSFGNAFITGCRIYEGVLS